jgi:hypothetical protein
MATVARIPRRRGGLCGSLLVLLGLWGAVIPFVGPYFRYEFSPDKAWAYTSGRLYLSILPGIAVLLGGLAVLMTRSRATGLLGGFLAAAGGAWFVLGYPVILEITKNTGINPGVAYGSPAGTSVSPGTAGVPVVRVFTEQIGFFTGLGVVVLFIAAIAIGRFSMLAARDVPAPTVPAQTGPDGPFAAGPRTGGQFPDSAAGYPATDLAEREDDTAATGQFPARQADSADSAGREPLPVRTTAQFPAATEQVAGGEEPVGASQAAGTEEAPPVS